jgi:choline dehydrogenase-like flavoprotein
MHKDLDDIDSLGEFDVCIIGSGPAGLSVASKLLGKGIRFIMVESGDVTPNMEHQQLNQGYSEGPRFLDVVNSRLRTFGGGGKLWAGVCRPFDPEEFDRTNNSYTGWPIKYTDLEKYYREAAELLGVSYSGFFSKDWREKAYLAVKFNDFASDSGLLRGVKYQRSSPLRRDLSNLFQEELFSDDDCVVLTNATVVNLGQEKEKVETIEVKSFSGKEISISAKVFVLCCGALENPRILLNSNISRDLRENKFLGSCFMSHPAFKGTASLVKSTLSGDCELDKNDLEWDFGFEVKPSEREKNNILRHNIHLSPASGFTNKQDRSTLEKVKANINILIAYAEKIKCKLSSSRVDSKHWELHISTEQEPRTSNRIQLSKYKDRHGANKLEVIWDYLSEREMNTISEASKAVGREARLTDIGLVRLSDELINNRIFSQNDAINHHIGTTRMAKSSENGVVNEDCKIFGLNNIYVAGSSVFPTSSIVNPTFTIVAMSLRLGEHIRSLFDRNTS